MRSSFLPIVTTTLLACNATPDGAAKDTGTFTLQAFGGASGEVAAQVVVLEPGVGEERTCGSAVHVGACQLTTCQIGGIGDPDPGFGDFGLMSASVGTTTEALTYGGFGYPSVYFPSSLTLGEGATMEFRGGNGAAVPSFDVSATIPGLGVITAPVPPTGGSAAIIDTSSDLLVTWLPISIGQIEFELDGGSNLPGGVAISIACTFEGGAGSGVVSQALLSTLKDMSGTTVTYESLSSEHEVSTVIDGVTIVTQSYQSSPPIPITT